MGTSICIIIKSWMFMMHINQKHWHFKRGLQKTSKSFKIVTII
jgi:hypothetical protein